MRFWNIGAEGQVLAGGLAAAACMICLGDKRAQLACSSCSMIVAGIAAGAVWAVIPAFFKAKWNTNETLFTLMMNYVATQLVAYFIIVWEIAEGLRQGRHHQPEHRGRLAAADRRLQVPAERSSSSRC